MTGEPFTYHVPDAALADLRERLARTRLPDQAPEAPWTYGTDVTYLADLIAYWRDGFDWRAEEAALNAFPQTIQRIGEIDIHCLHVPGQGPNPRPLLLCHGWPGSVFEFLDLIPRLTDPARFGGRPEDAFTVVAPSLPGYGLSFRPGQPRLGVEEIADHFSELMTRLGYDRFMAQGGTGAPSSPRGSPGATPSGWKACTSTCCRSAATSRAATRRRRKPHTTSASAPG